MVTPAARTAAADPIPDHLRGNLAVLVEHLTALSDALNADAASGNHPVGVILPKAEAVRLAAVDTRPLFELAPRRLPAEYREWYLASHANPWDAACAHRHLEHLTRHTLRAVRDAYLVEAAGVGMQALAWTVGSTDPLRYPFKEYRDHLLGCGLDDPPPEWAAAVMARLRQVGLHLREARPPVLLGRAEAEHGVVERRLGPPFELPLLGLVDFELPLLRLVDDPGPAAVRPTTECPLRVEGDGVRLLQAAGTFGPPTRSPRRSAGCSSPCPTSGTGPSRPTGR